MDEKKEQKPLFKTLPTDPAGVILPFKTANHKYQIIRPGEPMGISRWSEYRKFSIVFGMGKSFGAVYDAFDEIELMAVSEKPYQELKRDIVLKANSNKRGINEMSKARFDYGFYQASFFIVREGDEKKDWTYDLANEYITDWKEDGISEESFFFFAAKTVVGLKERSRKLKEEMEKQTGALLAISGYTIPDVMR